MTFWFRIFTGAFFIGSFTASLVYVAMQQYLHAVTQARFDAQSIPTVIVTNAFIDITIPGLSPIALTGFWAVAFVAISGGVLTGICALIFTALYRLLFGKRLTKKLS